VLEKAAERVKTALGEYPSLYDIADSYEQGKRELKLKLRPEARALGVTQRELARQVRGAFYGAEALRLQRDRNEVKVMVRYPLTERRGLGDVDALRIRTPTGGEIPFAQAAVVDEGRGYSQVRRVDRKRVINVFASANFRVANPNEIIGELRAAGACVLVTTHDLGDAERLADEVVIIDHGRVVAHDTPDALRRDISGDEIRFGAPSDLDVAAASVGLGAPVTVVTPGEYRAAMAPTPANVAALTQWLAANNIALADLQAGRQTLEDVFDRLTSEPTAAMPQDRRARRSRGRRRRRRRASS